MIYLFCGAIIGIVMGLTGAGGALVAIPLFIQFLGMSLKEASVYSLVAVVLASGTNFLTQKSSTQYRPAIIIVLFSAMGSYFASPFKANLPNWVMIALLFLVSLYALYSLWVPKNKKNNSPITKKTSEIFLSALIGISLGILTTFTGLGGGVLMMPIFLDIYYYSQKMAIATSLLAVSLSSLFSLLIQVNAGFNVALDMNLIFLIIGILLTAFALKYLVTKLPEKQIERSRQVVFTLVVILALIKIL